VAFLLQKKRKKQNSMLSFCVRLFFVTHREIQTAGIDARRTRMPTKESPAPYKNGFIQLPVYCGKLVSFLKTRLEEGGGGGGEREKCGYMLVGVGVSTEAGIRILYRSPATPG
jgi:hypothetical protein